jgi:hypothetical protein
VTWEPRGSESPLAQTKRFKQDRRRAGISRRWCGYSLTCLRPSLSDGWCLCALSPTRRD